MAAPTFICLPLRDTANTSTSECRVNIEHISLIEHYRDPDQPRVQTRIALAKGTYVYSSLTHVEVMQLLQAAACTFIAGDDDGIWINGKLTYTYAEQQQS